MTHTSLTGAGKGIAGFTPLEYSPSLWLDASSGVYSDGGTTLATNGQTVQQWNDISGNGRNFSQGTGTARPTYRAAGLNVLPTLEFDGTTDVLTATAEMTVFSVASPSATISAIRGLYGNGNFYLGAAATDAVSALYQPSTGFATASSGNGVLSTNTPVVLSYRIRNSAPNVLCEEYKNGVAVKTQTTLAATLTAPTAATMAVGARASASGYWAGNISEVIAFTSALSDAQRSTVEAYLSAKWGI